MANTDSPSRVPPALWPVVSALFDQALAMPESERAAWLSQVQAEQADAAPHLLRMLAAHATASTLTPPAGDLLAAALQSHRRAPQAGQLIGIYRLMQLLGQGGMATVWEAEQTQGVLRRVALKLPHAGLEAPEAMARRFEQERDLLATLEHPNIARLYDAGITTEADKDGQPYLAMELIHGQPITMHAAGLPLAERLALFQQVLAAVSFAHGRLVIHRDIKPSNILVTAQGQVKLLDFGIARLLGQGDAAPTGLPGLLGLSAAAFTPDCAPPEQLAGQPLDVTADVYALGVVLFELLTGQRPYRLDRRLPQSLAEQLAAQLTAQMPPRPSYLPSASRRALAGDLDAIVGRAMAFDAAQRYQSVESLAADLRRHLGHWPVQAREGGWRYRMACLLKRQRVAMAAGCAVVLALGIGLGVALWQADEARANARRAEAVKAFLLGVFSAVDPRRPSDQPRGQITARQLMDTAVERIDRDFAADVPLRIELLGVTSEIYGFLEEEQRYDELHRRHMDLVEKHLGPTHPVFIQGLLTDAYGDIYSMHPDAARQTLARVDELLNRAGLNDTELRAGWWMAQSEVLRGTPGAHAQRQQALENALPLYQRHAPQSSDYAAALANLGNVFMAREQWAPAQLRFEQALAMPIAAGGSEENLPNIHTNLALALMEQGAVPAALKHFEQAEVMALRTFGPAHSSYYHATGNHARWLHRLGERERANQIFEGLAVAPGGSGPGDDTAREYRAAALLNEGRAELALPILLEVQRAYTVRVDREADMRRLQGLLGSTYAALGQPIPAAQALQSALQTSERHDAASSAALAGLRERYARFLLDQGDATSLRKAATLLQAAAQDVPQGVRAAQVLAQAGLARLALVRGELPAADAAISRALALWPKLPASREVRIEVYLLKVQAAVVEAQAGADAARPIWALALAQSRRYSAPTAPAVLQPRRLQL